MGERKKGREEKEKQARYGVGKREKSEICSVWQADSYLSTKNVAYGSFTSCQHTLKYKLRNLRRLTTSRLAPNDNHLYIEKVHDGSMSKSEPQPFARPLKTYRVFSNG